MIIREATRADFASVAHLMRFTNSFEADEGRLVQAEALRSEEYPFLRQVVERNGAVIAYCKSQRYEIPRPVRFILAVAVEPEHRGQGIGLQLYELAEQHALANGAEVLWVQFREDNETGKVFADKRGYKPCFYLQDLVLRLDAFDPEPFHEVVEAVEASGIRFVPYSQMGDNFATRHALYELDRTLHRDVPNFGQDEQMTFDHWHRQIMGAKWFDPDGELIAVDGEKWVGVGSVGEFFSGTFVNAMTGVLREYRGRKIALALKLLGIEFARSKGGVEIRTQNHGTNEAILAINKRLGYQGLPGWWTYEKAGVRVVGP